MATPKTFYVARWDRFGYNGKPVDRGQIVDLTGAVNDEKLLRLGYVIEVKEANPKILECGVCGEKFHGDNARLSHGRRRHPEREERDRVRMAAAGAVDPRSGEPAVFVDTDGDREDRQREEDTPLYLDNTEANRR